MTIRIGLMALAPLAAGVLLLPLAACSKDERRATAYALKGIGIEDRVTLAEIEEAEAERAVVKVADVPEPCVVPSAKFRELWCNPDTGNLETIR